MPLTIPYNAPSEVAFTPSWTNITVGSGTSVGFYVINGKLILFRAEFTFGAGSSMGSPALALPLTAVRAPLSSQIDGRIRPAAGGQYLAVVDAATPSTTSTGTILVANASSTYVTVSAISSTVPVTWTTGDRLQVSGWYMAA